MTAVLIEFVFLAAVIFVVGVFLSKFADQIAELTGLGRVLIGSVLLAGATSLPELTVDITAVELGETDLAAGDLLGSNLINLLILAVLDLTYHSKGKMLSREAAGHALSGTLSMAMMALLGLAIVTAPKMPHPEFAGLCLPTWGLLAAYVLGVRVVFLDQRISAAVTETIQSAHQPAWPPLWKPLLGFFSATAVLVLTGPRLADAAARFADVSGLGNTFVGTTFVALSTSLPELVSSLAALRMKAFDLAVGNVFGSNAFNILLFVPLDFLHPGPLFSALSTSHAITCMGGIAATCIAVMGQLYRVEVRRKLFEPDAWLVIFVALGVLMLVYRMS